MPLNVMDAHYRSFERLVLPELVKRHIGVLGMKSMANGVILKSGLVTAVECLHYALSLPTSVVITGIDSLERLDQAFEAARTLHRMNEAERRALLAGRVPPRLEASSNRSKQPPSSIRPLPILRGSVRSPSTFGS